MTDIIDHVGITAADFGKAKAFYVATLGTLGIELLSDFAHAGTSHAGFGKGNPTFWLSSGKQHRGEMHLCFKAASRAEVVAFYTVALSMGGRDNGPPGIRAHYHPNYFGAFVYDLDGNNIEAVCHDAE